MRTLISALTVLSLVAPKLGAQRIPSFRDHFGFEIGEDRKLADWGQLVSWYELLAGRSPRVTLDTLGQTTLGQPFIMLTITSVENHARLDELHDIQMKLADPRRVPSDQDLSRLLDEGRTVVLVTHGIHATEVGGPQMAARLIHHLATSGDQSVREILDNVILLDIPSLNPDGLRMIVDWYRPLVGTEFEAASLPMLYHYYVGHDNNRDWYAFTQIETELTVTEAHNAWHPQIVHDIHQTRQNGARIIMPPFIDPWEPNIDPRLTGAVNQLGAYMAAELLKQGKTGVAIHAVYDAFTPARAYQHYHGGARILTETASIRLATPITLAPEALGANRGFDAATRGWNFPAVWPGGEWHLANIVDYMQSGVMALLTHAARNRRFWLENFYEINESAVAGWAEWPAAWVLREGSTGKTGLDAVLRILRIGDVEVHTARQPFTLGGHRYAAGTHVVRMNQPYASFAQTLLTRQKYPDLRLYPGGPPLPPYDVTAHTLPLLMGIEAVPLAEAPPVRLSAPVAVPTVRYRAPSELVGRAAPRIGVYKSWREPMSEGWTRWVFDQHGIAYDTLHDADVRKAPLEARYDVLLFEDQPAGDIVYGWAAEQMPAAYAGGLGSSGVQAVRRFVEAGGRVIAIGEATDFAVEAFDLGIESTVADLAPQEFYIPGSILKVSLEPESAITGGMPAQTAAWYWESSRAFETSRDGVRVVARYLEHIAGKPALVEVPVGRGSVVLFGFPPNYRGQTIATWPLLFNAMRYRRAAMEDG
jgi:hypothetical protein